MENINQIVEDPERNAIKTINMDKEIKSTLILKTIFLYLNKKKELEIIKYNKSLQKKLNINIKDFKIISGKYKIIEEKGKGKEYDNLGNIIFEGEYLNGKKNGKGKEYSNGELRFEGEYLNGKRNGKGKEYFKGRFGDFHGSVKFQGEYINDYRYNGKIFDENGNLVGELKNGNSKGKVKEGDECGYFEGEYINGKRNGKATENFGAYTVFKGEYLNGKKNGILKEYVDDKLIFEGEYLNGERNGKGKEYSYESGKLVFEGEYLNGEKWNGKIYCQNQLSELKNGNGIRIFTSFASYICRRI